MEESSKNEDEKIGSIDEDIFDNTGDDVKIDINKKILEKYKNKIKEKNLKKFLEELGGVNILDNSEKLVRNEMLSKYLINFILYNILIL